MLKNLPILLRPVALLTLLALLLGGCVSTKLEKSWTAPEVSALKFTNILVLALTTDDFNRRLAEVAVKTRITQIPSRISYEFLPAAADTKNKEKVRQVIKDSGADGLVVIRLVYADTNVTAGPNTARPMEFQTFSTYYGATYYDVGAYFASDTREITADRVFTIEANIYDAKTEKLIWSGQTRSVKNSVKDHDIFGLVTEVADAIKAELKSQGLVQ